VLIKGVAKVAGDDGEGSMAVYSQIAVMTKTGGDVKKF